MNGANLDVSSSIVARTLVKPISGSIRVKTQLLHQSQCWWRAWSPCNPPITGSPAITLNESLGTAIEVEKALADMRWQPVQWHTMASSGGAVMRKRVRPQRQPPSIGNVGLVMGCAALPICGGSARDITGCAHAAGNFHPGARAALSSGGCAGRGRELRLAVAEMAGERRGHRAL